MYYEIVVRIKLKQCIIRLAEFCDKMSVTPLDPLVVTAYIFATKFGDRPWVMLRDQGPDKIKVFVLLE